MAINRHYLTMEIIKPFAEALYDGNLGEIQNVFKSLSLSQKKQLLNYQVDYNSLWNTMDLCLPFPFGKPTNVAQELNHSDIFKYLTQELNNLKKISVKASFNYFFGEKYNAFIPEEVSQYLNEKDIDKLELLISKKLIR